MHFVGEPVTAALHDAANGRAIAALRMGHFGVKLRVSDDRGKSWEEVASPAYPPKPEGIEDSNPWTLDQVWILEGFQPKQPQRAMGRHQSRRIVSLRRRRPLVAVDRKPVEHAGTQAVDGRRLRHSGHSLDLRAP